MSDPLTPVVYDTSLATIESIIKTLQAFKNGERTTDYDAGYDDGFDQAIRAVRLYRNVIETKQAEYIAGLNG